MREKKEGRDLKNIVLGQISTIAIFAFSLHWQSHSTKYITKNCFVFTSFLNLLLYNNLIFHIYMLLMRPIKRFFGLPLWFSVLWPRQLIFLEFKLEISLPFSIFLRDVDFEYSIPYELFGKFHCKINIFS